MTHRNASLEASTLLSRAPSFAPRLRRLGSALLSILTFSLTLTSSPRYMKTSSISSCSNLLWAPIANAKREPMFGCWEVGSKTRIVRSNVGEATERWMDMLGGRGGLNEEGEGGSWCHEVSPGDGGEVAFVDVVVSWFWELEGTDGVKRFGPLRVLKASRIIECSRCNWDDMNDAECLSPVHRVMSMQSKAWLRRVRREERAGSNSGFSESRDSVIGGWVFRRRWSC